MVWMHASDVRRPALRSDKLHRGIDIGIAGQEIAEGLTFASLLANIFLHCF
jgi:hypothetical protein